HLDRRAVLPGAHAVRAAAFASDRGVRRNREGRADARGGLTIVSLSSIGLPGTNGFVGEFLVLLGTFRTYPLAATTATAGVIVAAMYLLPALQRVIFNPLDKNVNERLADLSLREIAVRVPLLACIVWIGVYPKPMLER